MQRIAQGLLAAALLSLLTSCAGYRMGTAKPADLAHVQKLAIPTFVNQTLEPRLSVLLTNSTIKEFQLDGTYEITSREDADATLVVQIRETTRLPFRFNRSDRLISRELNFQLVCDYVVEDAFSRDVITSGTATATSNLALDDNFQLTERQALADASSKLAIDLMTQVCEGW